MIRCKVCGRWVSKIHDSDKETRHLEAHELEARELVKAYEKQVKPYLENNFEVVRL